MRVIIDHHRTNGNAESFATKEYRTNDSDDDVDDDVADDDDNDVDDHKMLMKMRTLMTMLIMMLCTKMLCFLPLEMKKSKTWCGQQLQDREEALQEDLR